jgi:hypothetical protein
MAGGGKSTTTSEIKLPEWMNQAGQSTWQEASAAAKANPIQAYTGPTAAGSNANLDAAGSVAKNSVGAGQGDLAMARAFTGAAGSATTPGVRYEDWNAERMKAYMNPSLEAVQGRTLDAMRRSNSMELDALGDGAQGSKAYGGTRHAVLEAETRTGQGRNIMDYLAESNAKAYDDAYSKFATDRGARMGGEATNAGIAQGDFMRMMQAGGQAAGIGGQQQQLNTGDIENLMKTGLVQQGTEAGQIDGNYQEFLRMQDAPMDRYMQLMGMLSGTPTNKTQVDTSKQKGSLLNTLMGGGMMAASLFSDRRLKKHVDRVGNYRVRGETIGIYFFRYLWEPKWWPRHTGFMADEVKAVVPEAVKRAFGFDQVDYSALKEG